MDPRFKPMLCEPADAMPARLDEWVLQPKIDGWRSVMAIGPTGVTIYGGRNGSNYSHKLPYIADSLRTMLPVDTVVDGELIGEGGWNDVQSLMTRGGRRPHVPSAAEPALTYVVFDILELRGTDVRALEFRQRRQLLEAFDWPEYTNLIPQGEASTDAHLRMLDMGMEGSVVKRLDSTYVNRRSRSWIKLKAIDSDDCVIVGFNEGKNGRAGQVGAIVVELPACDRANCNCGRGPGVTTTASGMNDKLRGDMLADPDKYLGQTVEIAHNLHLPSGKVRHPRFKRMRDDRSPAPAPAPSTRPRRAGGPKMRAYNLMGDEKLLRCLRELRAGGGDAYDRVGQHAGTVQDHINEAREQALSRGLAVGA